VGKNLWAIIREHTPIHSGRRLRFKKPKRVNLRSGGEGGVHKRGEKAWRVLLQIIVKSYSKTTMIEREKSEGKEGSRKGGGEKPN